MAFRMSFISVALALLVAGATALSHAQDLPLDIQIDLTLSAFERAVMAGDHAEMLKQIARLHALDPAIVEGELLYFEAQAAMGTGDLDRAERSLDRFLVDVGRQSASYPDALALKLDLSAMREAVAEADRIAEQQAAADRMVEELRINAQTQEERLRAGEQALNLSALDIRHVRFILHQYSGELFAPHPSPTLTEADRNKLQAYLRDKGMAATNGYLTEELAQHFRSIPFVPVWTPASPQNRSLMVRSSNSGNWTVEEYSDNCVIYTPATSFTQGSFYAHPRMSLMAFKSNQGSSLVFRLVSTNPFRVDRPVIATVDGRDYELMVSNNMLQPRRTGSSELGNDVTKAIRAGETVTIRGTHMTTSREIFVSFSAMGFTQAFTLMAQYCNRPGILSWIQ